MVDRRHGGSVRAAALYIGVSHTTVLRWLRGETVPDPEACKKIAIWAKVPEDYILRLAGHLGGLGVRDPVLEARSEMERLRTELSRLGSVIEQHGSVEFPVLGSVPAGYPSIEEQQVIRRVTIPAGAFWLQVSGESLVDLGIESGDLIAVDPGNREPRQGQITVVRLRRTNEVTVKRWYREDDHVRLEPANHQYRAIIATDVEVLGVVVFSGRTH